MLWSAKDEVDEDWIKGGVKSKDCRDRGEQGISHTCSDSRADDNNITVAIRKTLVTGTVLSCRVKQTNYLSSTVKFTLIKIVDISVQIFKHSRLTVSVRWDGFTLTLRELHDPHTDSRDQVAQAVVSERVPRQPWQNGNAPQQAALQPGTRTPEGRKKQKESPVISSFNIRGV